MNQVWTVAKNTFVEAIRDRVLYSIVVFAILMMVSSLIVGTISADQHNKIVKDFALAAISFFGIMLSVFLGTALVYKEIEKKTVYNIFSKPLHRYQFITGKYLGLSLTLLIITLSMFVTSILLVLYIENTHKDVIEFYYKGHFYAEFIVAVYFQYLEFLIVIGVALVFSSFTTPVLSVLMTLLVFVVGRFSSDVRLFAEEIKNPFVSSLSEVLYRVIPNLEKLNFRSEAVYGGKITLDLLASTTGYALMYVCILLLLSMIIFEKRELK